MTTAAAITLSLPYGKLFPLLPLSAARSVPSPFSIFMWNLRVLEGQSEENFELLGLEYEGFS